MRQSSAFLFDDREYFTFGEVCSSIEEVPQGAALVEYSRSENKPPALAFMKFFSAVAMTVIYLNGAHSSSTPLQWPTSLRQGGQITTYDLEPFAQDRKLATEFKNAKSFLGLKQLEVAQITGISKSTIEKVDQNLYSNIGPQVREQMLPLIELCQLLKEHFGEKKFIARSRLNTPDSLLGNKTPLEYAKANGLEGLYEIIGLERKSLG